MLGITALVAALLCFAGPALALEWSGSEEMRQLLMQMQDSETPPTPLRADIQLKFTGPETSFRERAVMILLPAKDAKWYIELEQGKFKAIVIGLQHSSFWKATAVPAAKKGTLADAIGRTELIFADLTRFLVSDYPEARIVDENPDEIQIGMYTKPGSPYVYRVYTIDKERKVHVKVQYFEGKFNNLAKIRLDSDHVQLFGKWLPRRIVFEDFARGSKTELSVEWKQLASFSKDLFEPESLSKESRLEFAPVPEPSPPRAQGKGSTGVEVRDAGTS